MLFVVGVMFLFCRFSNMFSWLFLMVVSLLVMGFWVCARCYIGGLAGLSFFCHCLVIIFSALSALLGVAVDCCYLFRLQTQPGGVIVVVFLFSFESL